MRAVKSLDDAQIVINELLNWKSKIETKDWDFHQLKITNAGPAVNNNDYVIKSQLPAVNESSGQSAQDYTIVFSNSTTVADGDVFAEYIFGKDRVGYPT